MADRRREPGSNKRGRGRPKKAAGTTVDRALFLRASGGLLARIDAHLERLKRKNPAFRLHRSDVVRTLVERALSIEESEAQREFGHVPQFPVQPGELQRSPAARYVLQAIRAVADESLVARLAHVYARCRGISRRDYEDGLRELEASGLVVLERVGELDALTEQDRIACLVDQRGTFTRASLRAAGLVDGTPGDTRPGT